MNDKDDFRDSGYEEILNMVLKLAEGDYSARGKVSDRSDDSDAIITALNMLAEELSAREAGEGRDGG
jgi:hypothetical protein